MTRSDRIRAACERFAEGPPEGHAETVNQGIEAALGAALADVGGLDGLDLLRADRDRLREALRVITTQAMPGSLNETVAHDALRDSEAGT